MENKSSHNQSADDDSSVCYQQQRNNARPCPSCGTTIFGMPGGRDAHCPSCGYKDPCCSD